MNGVYPRACGGTVSSVQLVSVDSGLSPRLRGNLLAARCSRCTGGSIPAPAGEPVRASVVGPYPEVYPRACGGTAYRELDICLAAGLSPRLRGNHDQTRNGASPARSIPAPAGEPHVHVASVALVTVYPRACGGTAQARYRHNCPTGLSPRLRGNRAAGCGRLCARRSIPAPAGEPWPMRVKMAL